MPHPEVAHAYIEVVPVMPGVKLLPTTWAFRQGIKLLSFDGWDIDGKSIDEPVTEEEFDRRVKTCTIRMRAVTP